MLVVLALLLALCSGALSLDKLNMCMDAKHHKVKPGPEGQLYLQVMNIYVPRYLRYNKSNECNVLSQLKCLITLPHTIQTQGWKQLKLTPSLLSSVLHGVKTHVVRPTPAQKPTTINPTCTTSTGITVEPWALTARNISSRTLASTSAHHTWDPGYKQCVLCFCAINLLSVWIYNTRWQHKKLKGLKGLVRIVKYTYTAIM